MKRMELKLASAAEEEAVKSMAVKKEDLEKCIKELDEQRKVLAKENAQLTLDLEKKKKAQERVEVEGAFELPELLSEGSTLKASSQSNFCADLSYELSMPCYNLSFLEGLDD